MGETSYKSRESQRRHLLPNEAKPNDPKKWKRSQNPRDLTRAINPPMWLWPVDIWDGDCDGACVVLFDSSAVSGYVEALRGLACEILDLMAEGLRVPDSSVFSRLIRDVDSDSLFRLNHYPPLMDRDTSPSSFHHQHHHHHRHQHHSSSSNRIGFGEHSDPQILTILRSNDVGGLEISLDNGVWIPVTPDSTAFCINVGDVLQAMTNGRFVSVRHRALANSDKSRMSMAYFSAPSPHARITSPPEFVTPQRPYLYRPFTWAEYKKAAYSLRLGDSRLSLFRAQADEEISD